MKRALTLGKVPLKSLRAHPVRTIVLLLLTVAQAACVFGGLTMMRSMQDELALADARLGADILIYPSAAMSRISSKTLLMQGSPVEVWKDRSMLSRTQDCGGIERMTYQLYIRDTTRETPTWIVSFDPMADFVITPWVTGYDVPSLPDGAVLVGCKADGQDAVTLFGQSWPIAARLTETGSELDDMVFVSPNTLAQLLSAAESAGITAYRSIDPHNDFTVVLVRVRSGANLDSVTSWLNTYIRKVKAVRSEETLADTSSGIHGQISLIAAIAVAAWIVLLLALGIAQSMMMKERKKELYLWHAIGATRSIVNRIMMREALLIHGVGAALGVLAAGAVLCLLRSAPFSIPYVLTTVLLSVVSGCVSAMIAVRRTAKAMNGQMLLNV